MRRALEEAEEEMRRKSKLIQEIRAIESVPINRLEIISLASLFESFKLRLTFWAKVTRNRAQKQSLTATAA